MDRWWSRLSFAVCMILISNTSYAFVSKIRSETNKIPCHQVFDLYRAYVYGGFTSTEALTKLEILCSGSVAGSCVMVGQDLDDLTAFKNVIDTVPKLELGVTTDPNALENHDQQTEKLKKVDKAEAACRLFELNNDNILNETQLRNGIGIP